MGLLVGPDETQRDVGVCNDGSGVRAAAWRVGAGWPPSSYELSAVCGGTPHHRRIRSNNIAVEICAATTDVEAKEHIVIEDGPQKGKILHP